VWARSDSENHQVRVLTRACSGNAIKLSRRDIVGSGVERSESVVLRVAD